MTTLVAFVSVGPIAMLHPNVTNRLTAGARSMAESQSQIEEPTDDALAKKLGRSRMSLHRWRVTCASKRCDCRGDKCCPKNRSLIAWRLWIIENNKARAAESIPASVLRTITPHQAERINWKERGVELICERLRRNIARSDAGLLVADELAEPLGFAFLVMNEKLRTYPARVAPRIAGLRDVYEIEDRMRELTDADLLELNAAEFLENPRVIPDAVKRSVEAALKKKGGVKIKNRRAFAALVEAVCRKWARKVGERILADQAARSQPDRNEGLNDAG